MSSPGFKTRSSAGLSASGPATQARGAVTDPALATSSTAQTVGYAGFAVRAANSIAYHSPKFFGAQVKGQWSTNERASNDGKLTGNLWSVGANYDMGPLSVLAAYERHEDWSGLNVVGDIAGNFGGTTPAIQRAGAKSTIDTGVKVGAGYELGMPFGTTTVGAVWELLTFGYSNTNGLPATAMKDYKRQAFMVNLKHRMGNHEFRARYEYADNGECSLVGGGTCNADIGRGAQNYALGYAYYLSKAAQVYAYATKIENERGAQYTFATAGPAALTSSWAAGADPFGAGLGMRYAF
jgi:predicted porin